LLFIGVISRYNPSGTMDRQVFKMKKYRWLFLSILLAGYGCTGPAPAEPDLTQMTIKDIMDSMIDPAADFLFDSLDENVTELDTTTEPFKLCWLEDKCDYIVDERTAITKAPKTDEEWLAVRRHAVTLVEAPNLLILPGRKVAQPGEKSEYPEVELEPEQIQTMIDGDRANLIKFSRGLQGAAMMAVKAADTKNQKLLFTATGEIDKACETCHLHYWYPNDKRAAEAASRR
jgi:hypothetical protein